MKRYEDRKTIKTGEFVGYKCTAYYCEHDKIAKEKDEEFEPGLMRICEFYGEKCPYLQ